MAPPWCCPVPTARSRRDVLGQRSVSGWAAKSYASKNTPSTSCNRLPRGIPASTSPPTALASAWAAVLRKSRLSPVPARDGTTAPAALLTPRAEGPRARDGDDGGSSAGDPASDRERFTARDRHAMATASGRQPGRAVAGCPRWRMRHRLRARGNLRVGRRLEETRHPRGRNTRRGSTRRGYVTCCFGAIRQSSRRLAQGWECFCRHSCSGSSPISCC